jgi:hypothetical protein
MNKKNERIYIDRWLDLKPYADQVPTDSYYLKLSNEVKRSILTTTQSLIIQAYLDNDEIDLMACFLTSYFEDLISDTNIWNSFIHSHKRLYDKQLPFYDVSEYYEKEINLQDICFLMWYFMNTIQQDHFFAPFNDFIIETAKRVLFIFDQEWEYAPENDDLRLYYVIDENETDYYIARDLIDTVLFGTYLFYPDTKLNLLDSEFDILEKNRNDENLINFLTENRDHTVHHAYTRLLGLKGQEWTAYILGEDHTLSTDFLKISEKIRGYFFYKGQDTENVFLEHIASGKKFNLTKKSVTHFDTPTEIDTIVFMGIVLWKNEWWFSGIYVQSGFNADLVLDEKNSLESRAAVNFLDHRTTNMEEILRDQLKAFKEFNEDKQIAFMGSEKIGSFITNYIQFYNNSLKLSKKEKGEANKRARKEGFFGGDTKKTDFSEVAESGLVFFNPKSGTELALGVNSAFPAKNNPFYNEAASTEHIMHLLIAEDLSTELVMYCVANFKSDLAFFKNDEGKLYLENLDFLLRFWKRGNYFTKPSITFTGGENTVV